MKTSNVILLFDPGHGTREYTKGKRSPDETLFEGEWSREMVARIINACSDLGLQCINLVPEKEDITRMTRVDRANKIVKNNPSKQCYYISIHINAAGGDIKWHGATGFSVYVSRGASAKSKTLAKNIYDTAYDFGLQGNRSIPKEHYWQANYDVIYYTKCPAILTENLFMDNRVEVEYLKSEVGKETICNYHLVGICKTLEIPYSLIIA